MPEEAQAVEQPTVSQRLQNEFFGTEPAAAPVPAPAQQRQAEPNPAAAPNPEPKLEDEEILDPKDWLKREFDVEDIEVLKNERAEYKKLKETKPETFNWASEEAKKFASYINENKEDDLYEVLHQRATIKRLSKAEIADRKTAEDLVKFGMKQETPSLSQEDIDFLFNEKYGIPSKPVQTDFEDETEYNAKVASWQQQVDTINKRLTIEAKMNQPKFSQLLGELKLPEINKGETAPSPEELEKIKQLQTAFIEKANASVNSFKGFTAQVKDKDVDYAVSYTPSKEEKDVVSGIIQKFALENFDTNAIFADRWVNADGSINEIQMTEDLSRIFMGKNADAKLASEAANQRMELFLKEKKNINVHGSVNGSGVLPEGKSRSEAMQESFWGS